MYIDIKLKKKKRKKKEKKEKKKKKRGKNITSLDRFINDGKIMFI
jgi:hypothetical protein